MYQKYIKVNNYMKMYPKYIPVKQRSNKSEIIKDILFGGIAFITMWLLLWGLSYTGCVAQYKSSACKQDLTSQIIFKLIK